MYNNLEKQLRLIIEDIAPSTEYPKTCIIRSINNDSTVDIETSFGESATIKNLHYIGNPKLEGIGLLVRLSDDWKNSIVVTGIGEDGKDGEDGETLYTWIKYSDVASPTSQQMYDIPTANTKYIGISHNQLSPIESSNPSDYTWSKA